MWWNMAWKKPGFQISIWLFKNDMSPKDKKITDELIEKYKDLLDALATDD